MKKIVKSQPIDKITTNDLILAGACKTGLTNAVKDFGDDLIKGICPEKFCALLNTIGRNQDATWVRKKFIEEKIQFEGDILTIDAFFEFKFISAGVVFYFIDSYVFNLIFDRERKVYCFLKTSSFDEPKLCKRYSKLELEEFMRSTLGTFYWFEDFNEFAKYMIGRK